MVNGASVWWFPGFPRFRQSRAKMRQRVSLSLLVVLPAASWCAGVCWWLSCMSVVFCAQSPDSISAPVVGFDVPAVPCVPDVPDVPDGGVRGVRCALDQPSRRGRWHRFDLQKCIFAAQSNASGFAPAFSRPPAADRSESSHLQSALSKSPARGQKGYSLVDPTEW